MEQNSLWMILIFAVLFILIAVILYFQRRKQGKFDERQELMQGKASRYALYTFCGAYIVYILLRAIKGEKFLPYSMLAFTISVFLGIVVFAVYNIFHDSYFTEKQRPASYLIMSAAMILSQSANCVKIFRGEITLEKEPGSIHWCSLICAITFAIVFAATLIRIILSKKEQE